MSTMMIYSYQPDNTVKLDEGCQNTKTFSRPHSIVYEVEQWLANPFDPDLQNAMQLAL